MKRFLPLLIAALAATTAPAFAAGPCSLLNKAQAAKFLGTPIATVKAEDDGCRWLNAAKNENIYITVDTSGDAAMQMAGLNGHADKVNGVGVPAYFVAGTLFTQKGNTLVSVAIMKGEDSVNKMDAGLKSLARLVLSRL